MKEKKIEIGVGFLALLSIIALLFLCFKVAGNRINLVSSENTYQIHAIFSNVGSLKVGAPVRVSGVLVGRVIDINLDSKSYRADVKLQISGKYPFSTDATASILTMGILGEQYVSLQQGADEIDLENGGYINITNSAVVIEELLNKVIVNFFDRVQK